MNADTHDLPFDAVQLGERRMNVAEFLAIPLSTRVQLILERRVEFFLGAETVDRLDALRALRRISATA